VAAATAVLTVGDSSRAKGTVQTAPGSRGAVRTATTGATVQPPRSVTLSTTNGGRLTAVFVRPGQRVHQSQVLARVEDARLRQRLRAVERNLEGAKARLAKDKQRTIAWRRKVQIWSVLASTVRTQKVALDDARTAAKADKAGLERRIAGAEQTVAGAHGSAGVSRAELQATVIRAQRSLDHARTVSAADAAILEKQVAQARRNVDRAQIRAQAPNASLQTAVDQAQQSLDTAKASQTQNAHAYQSAVDQAQQTLAGAQSTLSNDQENLTSAQSDLDRYQHQVDSLQKKVDNQQAKVSSDKAALESCKANPPPEGCTSLQKVYDDDRATLNDLKTSLSTAESNLDGAKSNVSSLENTVASDQGSVASAQSSLTNARQAQSSGLARDAQTVQAAQDTLANAQQAAASSQRVRQKSMASAQPSLDSAIRTSRSRLARDRQAVRAAKASLAKARKKLASGSPGSEKSVQAAGQALESVTESRRSRIVRDAQSIRTAAYSLRSAQQSLVSSLVSNTTFVPAPTAADLAVAEIKVELAKLSVSTARENLVEGGVLRAPASGTVAAVSFGAGEPVFRTLSGVTISGNRLTTVSSPASPSLRASGGSIVLTDLAASVEPAQRRDQALRLGQRLRGQLAAAQEAAVQARTSVVGIAKRYLGVPYVWGGGSPAEGFDCSGLVLFVYAQVGVSLPHYAAAQYNYGVPVSRDQLEPGDLVFFDGLSHVGIYIGNDEFIQAPRTGDVVKISSIDEPSYATAYAGARRVDSGQRSTTSLGTETAARRGASSGFFRKV
jgi:cell wall-associated NlpC family hydrolase